MKVEFNKELYIWLRQVDDQTYDWVVSQTIPSHDVGPIGVYELKRTGSVVTKSEWIPNGEI